MKTLSLAPLAFSFFLISSLSAQQLITGNVLGDDSIPLIGATIQVQGTAQGTITGLQGEFQLSLATAGFNTHFLGKVQMKGKEQPIGIYECFSGDDPEVLQAKGQTMEVFEAALAHYFAREFGKAASLFEEVVKANPKDQPALLYHRKAGQYIVTGAPEDWTGVERMGVK